MSLDVDVLIDFGDITERFEGVDPRDAFTTRLLVCPINPPNLFNPSETLVRFFLGRSILDSASELYLGFEEGGLILEYNVESKDCKMMPPPDFMAESLRCEFGIALGVVGRNDMANTPYETYFSLPKDFQKPSAIIGVKNNGFEKTAEVNLVTPIIPYDKNFDVRLKFNYANP